MGRTGSSCWLWGVAFSVLLAGVMADTLDSDLIGVILAGVCLAVLIIIIIFVIAFCCYRRTETKRKAALVRKSSNTTTATNGIIPRWAPSMVSPPAMPVYSMPAADPVIYALPAPQYYLGQYTPKVIDAEAWEHMRYQYPGHRRKSLSDDENEHGRRHEHRKRKSHETQDVTREERTVEMASPEDPLQPNGHVANEFAASSVNYRVIRKQHKHEKMPEWLRKSYGENERTMDLEDEVSRASSDDLIIPPGTPEEVVRAQVSSHHSQADYHDHLSVSPGFTIVDYIDHDQQPRPSSSSHGEDRTHGAFIVTDAPAEVVDRHTDVTTTSDVTVDGSRTTTQKVITTTTTYYTSDSQVVSGGYVQPESTSTPRAVRQFEEREVEELGDLEDRELHNRRMRQPGEGSVQIWPGEVAHLGGSD